jgi:phage terminase large subunit-like protein
VKAGPKAAPTAEPLTFEDLPASGADRVIGFVEAYCVIPHGKGARRHMVLRSWQREIVRGLFDEPRPRQGLLSIPRGNGKTTLAAALALFGLFADNEDSAQVLCVASDERQAAILFRTARRMVELEPRLLDACQIFQDQLHVPSTDGTLRPLPAESSALLGWNPSLLIVDELAVVVEKVWESASGAAGKRERSLTLAISTPPESIDSVMFALAEYGRDGDDPSFYYREFSAPADCLLDDEDAWAIANPALGDFLALDAMRTVRHTMRESTFRRQRLGQAVYGSETWISTEAWKAAADPERVIEDGEEVCLGFDGSFNRDGTALVMISCSRPHHLQILGLWEKTPEDRADWKVSTSEVENAIRDAFRRYRVRAAAADPSWWMQTLETLAAEGVPVVEFRPSSSRMVGSTERFYKAIVDGDLTHSGELDLTRHVLNCTLKMTPSGPRVMKESKQSTRHVDLAIAAVLAFDQAALVTPETVPLVAWS